jgi:CotS family spore coat protein
MDKALLYSRYENIYDGEMELLEKILDNYDIEYNKVERVRSAYRVETNEGVYCLKMLRRGYKRGRKSYILSNALREKGFENLAPYVYTKDGEYLIRNKKSSFYLTEWIRGTEVSFNSIDDILDSARFLAQFHINARNIVIPRDIKIRNKHNRWAEVFNKQNEIVRGFVGKIEKKSKRAGFDILYKNNYAIYDSDAKLAMDLINTQEAKQAFDAAMQEGCICHDSFYYQNILRDENGKLYLIDFESSQLDCPMSDLGKFIRRVLYKHKYKWDFDLCRRIIDAYDSVRPITREEFYPLLAMIVYPHKYWKLGKKRYIKKKPWTEAEYQHKIKKVIKLQELKEDMVRSFIMFYGIHI